MKLKESLNWGSLDKFIRQLKVYFPNIASYIVSNVDAIKKPGLDKPVRRYPAPQPDPKNILKSLEFFRYVHQKQNEVSSMSWAQIPVELYYMDYKKQLDQKFNISNFEEFKEVLAERIEAFSYYISKRELADDADAESVANNVDAYLSAANIVDTEIWHVDPERDLNTHIDPGSRLFWHISHISNLDKLGLKPKASKRFENYSPRVYLFDISGFLKATAPEDVAKKLNALTQSVATQFNERYGTSNTYYGYMVQLNPGTRTELYTDTKWPGAPSFYITVPVPAKNVDKVVTVDP